MRRRLGSWVVLAVLAAVPHLLQDASIAYLTRDRLADPALARLASRIHRRDQAGAAKLLE